MKVKDLLTYESNWVKGVYAKTAEGRNASYCDPDAIRFCLLGAINRCYPPLGKREVVNRVVDQLSGRAIAEWNDDQSTTFTDVRNLVEKLDI